MGQWSNRLRQYDSAYQQSEAATNHIPDGRYKVEIERAEIRPNTFSGDLELVLDMVIIDGDYADRHIFKRHNLEQEQRFPFLKGDLETCGLSLNTLSELEDRLHELIGVTLEVSLRTVQGKQDPTKTYQNCYVVRRLERNAQSAPEPVTERGDPFLD
ncbi:DUF669 domain-containing protein [Alicyclobacillus macrosporangiidus]|uniref:DUF669 domain-containing protein n=1 Tax=Alicyclobacillus macrosporangiidus TaxID=392015 RepID=A0A1I7J9N2_9BACL|nr:DUF669 domain-containing protein [Alicyclobacillus macrosporangiidus]SFU81916.1 Protein of unknown function [Alicyclobacillus macrosporangiidus]